MTRYRGDVPASVAIIFHFEYVENRADEMKVSISPLSARDFAYCDFQTELDDGGYRHVCQREGCGRVEVTRAPRHRALCRVQSDKPISGTARLIKAAGTASHPRPGRPSLLRRAATFAAAELRWIAAGRPVRSVERVAELFTVCKACEHFQLGARDGEGKCRLCGCQLRRAGGLLNKIQMATESCPAQPPRWTAEIA